MRTGIKTTEFWVTLGVNVIAILAMTGTFSAEDSEGVKEAWTQIVGGVAAVVNNGLYVWSRTRVKQQSVAEK